MNSTVQLYRANNTYHSSCKKLITICVIITALFFLRIWNNSAIFPITVLGILFVVLCDSAAGFSLLLFMLPCAPILKIDPEQVSYFTFMFLAYNAKFLIKYIIRDREKIIKLIPLFILFCYNLIFSGINQIIANITMVLGLVMVMSVRVDEKLNFQWAIYAFSAGILLASIIALFKEQSIILEKFIEEGTIKLSEEEFIDRFAGLQGNPNYYTMDITIAIACLIATMSIKKFNLIGLILVTSLAVFGLMSASKSFLLSLVLLAVCLLIKTAFSKDIIMSLKIIIIFATLILGIYLFDKDALNTYMIRFNIDKGANISEISTGRSDIWISYLQSIISDPYILIFGNGLNTTLHNAKGAHNTYIETLFSLGVLGSIILLGVIRFIIKNNAYSKTSVSNKYILLIPVLLYLVRIFAIGTLTYDNTWYYISIMYLMYIDFTVKDVSEK